MSDWAPPGSASFAQGPGRAWPFGAAAGDEGQEQREQQDEGFPRNPHDDVSCVWFCG
jgi:hypothetical protein